jgi:hypothetical protein
VRVCAAKSRGCLTPAIDTAPFQQDNGRPEDSAMAVRVLVAVAAALLLALMLPIPVAG